MGAATGTGQLSGGNYYYAGGGGGYSGSPGLGTNTTYGVYGNAAGAFTGGGGSATSAGAGAGGSGIVIIRYAV